MTDQERQKSIAIIATKGTLDWAYPPFILASTAAAMDFKASIFFTFYGLSLLKKKIEAKVSPQGNPAMSMKLPFGPDALQQANLNVPNLITANMPGFETVATSMMKKTFAKKGVATIEELREASIDLGVRMIGCEMTMDVFGFDRQDFIEGIEYGGAATFLEVAAEADIQLFI